MSDYRYYHRNGEPSETWADLADDLLSPVLAEDYLENGIHIKTVYTGINLGSSDEPRIFETSIEGGIIDGQTVNYFKEEDAMEGHYKIMEDVSKPLEPNVQSLGDAILKSGLTNPYAIAEHILNNNLIKISPYFLVKEFHETYGMGMRDTPELDIPVRKMRVALVVEEAEEYAEAEKNDDLPEIADALADLVYVAYGAALEHGIDLDHVLQEVQRSNMSKLHHETGLPIYREDGKVLKGENFFPPNISQILREQGWAE